MTDPQPSPKPTASRSKGRKPRVVSERAMPEKDDNNLIIGEMRGQLREVVHSLNNLSSKFDGLAREVMALATLAGELGKLQAKVEMLETQKHRSDGVHSVALAVVKSPTLGWLVGAAASAWAVITGKVHL